MKKWQATVGLEEFSCYSNATKCNPVHKLTIRDRKSGMNAGLILWLVYLCLSITINTGYVCFHSDILFSHILILWMSFLRIYSLNLWHWIFFLNSFIRIFWVLLRIQKKHKKRPNNFQLRMKSKMVGSELKNIFCELWLHFSFNNCTSNLI